MIGISPYRRNKIGGVYIGGFLRKARRHIPLKASMIISGLGVLILALAGFGCDDDGITQANNPILSVDPLEVVLSATEVGRTSQKSVTLSNTGNGQLIVIGLTLSNELSSLEFALEHTELPLSIDPGESEEVTVIYSPQNEGVDSGKLVIDSNSRDGRITEVRISTALSASELIYAPEALFSLSQCDVKTREWLRFQNFGAIQVDVTDVSLSEDSSPAFSLGAMRITRQEDIGAMGGSEGSAELASEPINLADGVSIGQGDVLEIEVIYDGAGDGDDRGALQISHQRDNGIPYAVQLKGARLQPQVQISPEWLDFGAVDLNEMTPAKRVVITNIGSATLSVESVNFAINDPEVNAQFSLSDVDLPPELAPDQSFSFDVSYSPMLDGRHRTSVSVSFGECEGQVAVPVSGRVKAPCIQVTPDSVNFGSIALTQPSAPSQLELLNCGDASLEVTEVTLASMDQDFSWRWIDPSVSLPFTLEPRMTQLIEVSYINQSLNQGAISTGTLSVSNSSPETPTLEVPLSVTGGGAPTCTMLILPSRMNFGLVSRGRSVTRTLRAANGGTGTCEIRSQTIEPFIPIPIPGFNDVKFTLTQPVAGNQVAAGQILPFEITYTPEIFTADNAVYKLTYYDPFEQQEKEATSDLSGISGESNIEVIPSRLNFGQVTAGDCASREERVTVYNTGLVDLCINDISLEGPNCDEFLITDRPIANQDGCIIVTRNSPADVKLVYEPGNLGEDSCNLVFTSDAADTPELLVPLSGEGVSNSNQVDEFVQTSGQTVDVLFVIDNSGSMDEEQQNLQDNFAEFIRGAQLFQNDYQIGVVTTDMNASNQSGRLQSPRIIRNGPTVEQDFTRASDVGTSGAGDERGLSAAQAALSDPLAFDTGVACTSDADCVDPDACVEGYCGGFNRGFLRESAALEVIFVSDEDDYSEGNLNFYVDFLKNIKGFRNEGRFHANAIVGAHNGQASSCNGVGGQASAGSRYVEVAQRTNGRVYSICEDDFGRPLQEIGNQAFGLPVQFFLTRPADSTSITVEVDGQMRPNGWTYDPMSNSIIFVESTVPQPGQTVRVTYTAQCFPREGN
jgi:hypothetical protein